MSMNKDNSHSWVRISHGSNKFVMNLNNNEQKIPEVQLEEYALKLDAKDFASRSKAEAKPQRRELAGSSTRTIPIGKRIWIDVEPGEYSHSDYDFCEEIDSSRAIFRNISCIVIICLTKSERKAWQEEEETRKDTSTVLILQE